MYALWIQNTSESDPCSYEATKTVVKKALKNYEASTGLEHMTSVMPATTCICYIVMLSCADNKLQVYF